MTSRRLLTTTSRILLDAADYMEKHGHCRRVLTDHNGAVCLLGSLLAVTGGHGVCKDYLFAARALQHNIGTVRIPDWNDLICKSKDEAVSALRSAALSDYALKAM